MRNLISVIVIALSFSFSTAFADDGKLSVGDKIPENLGVTRDGNKIIASDHHGKIMVVSFWATWCPPCRKELPIIDNLQRLAGKENLSVIAVNYGEKSRTFRKFTSKLGEVNLTFTHDKKGQIGQGDFGVRGIPHMVIANHEGIIEHIHVGYGDETVNNLAKEINALLVKRHQANSQPETLTNSD